MPRKVILCKKFFSEVSNSEVFFSDPSVTFLKCRILQGRNLFQKRIIFIIQNEGLIILVYKEFSESKCTYSVKIFLSEKVPRDTNSPNHPYKKYIFDFQADFGVMSIRPFVKELCAGLFFFLSAWRENIFKSNCGANLECAWETNHTNHSTERFINRFFL